MLKISENKISAEEKSQNIPSDPNADFESCEQTVSYEQFEISRVSTKVFGN